MREFIKNLSDKFVKKIPKEKRPLTAIVIGIILIFLITASGMGHNDEPGSGTAEPVCGYAEETEKKLEKLISEIEGAGKTMVMVTLDVGEENIYANDIKNDAKEYVVIKANSEEGGMLLKIIQPKIRGVAVVCAGGDSYTVKNNILNTVCSVLNIRSSSVSITKMKDPEGIQ